MSLHPNTRYRVFLYSSDVNRLVHACDFVTPEEATACVKNWLGDRDYDEQLADDMFRVNVLLNGHLRGAWHVNIVARHPDWHKDVQSQLSVEGLSDEEIKAKAHAIHVEMAKKQKTLLRGSYLTYETAKLEIDRAIDNFLSETDPTLYGRIQRENRAKGIHEPFLTDAKPFGFEIYSGEYAVRYKHANDTTLEELKAIRFKEAGIGLVSAAQAFNVESGALRVTDPCYSMDTWCAGTAENVLNGQWYGHIQYYNEGMSDYSIERWEEMLATFEKEQEPGKSEVLKIIMGDAEFDDISEERKQRLKEHLQSRLFEDFNGYGNPDDWKGRVAYLHIRHSSVLSEPIDPSLFKYVEGLDVGVDSGQAGFFDLDKYAAALADKSDSRENQPIFEEFYGTCGAKTLSRESWGATKFGVVSSSGYGDGGYRLYERRNEAGMLVEARIIYLLEGSETFPDMYTSDEEDEGAEE